MLVYDIPAVVALRADLAHRPSVSNPALLGEVSAVVDHLKAAGWPPERVIIAVKQIAEHAGLRPSRALLSASKPLSRDDEVLVQVVQWSIERYYSLGTSAPSHTPLRTGVEP
jgi:hypothetical protein